MSIKPHLNPKVLKIVGGSVLSLIVITAAVIGAAFYFDKPEKTEITTATMPAHSERGRIIEGDKATLKQDTLQANDSAVYESAQIATTTPKANAAVLSWGQSEANTTTSGDVHTEFRTFNGTKWSGWVDAHSDEDRKDGSSADHKALVLADAIQKIQYRFELNGKDGKPSPEVSLKDAKLELIDSNKGPSPYKQNPVKKTLQNLGFMQRVGAQADGPRIYTRADWGAPEPNSSRDWQPEYRKLQRVIVHHTATTATSDPAVAIRAVWQFHAKGRGWGDIGYNYLVDGNGAMYQGRYFDHKKASDENMDAVGGHAYGWNYGSTGIAALGNFTGSNRGSEAMIRSIGTLAAYKMHKYGINPTGFYGNTPVIIGHRDAVQTACPANLYSDLSSIRTFAGRAYPAYYSMNNFDGRFIAMGRNNSQTNEITLKSGETADVFADYRNEGVKTWGTGGMHIVRLGADSPRDRRSAFANGSWVNPSRPAAATKYVMGYNQSGAADLMSTSEIKPGQVGRFAFQVKAPDQPGTYTESFQPVAEGFDWFRRNIGIRFKINVQARNFAWQGTSQKVYTDSSKATVVSDGTTLNNLRAGQRYYVETKIRNNGDQTWKNDGANPVRLGTFRPADRPSAVCDSTWSSCNRAADMQEANVAPGATATFGFWVNMPYHTDDRSFKEHFNLVAEGQKWAPDQGMYWQFNVAGEKLTSSTTGIRGYTNSSKSQTVDFANLAPNTRYYVVMTMKNTGNVIWKDSGLRQVRLGTSNPFDRKSGFCDSTWLSPTNCNRIVAASSASVAPGASTDFGYWIKTPGKGTYTSWVSPVAEGFSWFRDSSVPLVVTVK